MSLVFYYAPWSSASTCLWALEELGVPHERVRLDLAKKETRTASFRALNPNERVPLLVHDGTPIFESVAILLHLGETFGVEKKLFPAPGIDRALAFQWLVWTNASLGVAAGRYMLTSSSDRIPPTSTSERVPTEFRNEALASASKGEAERLLGILDKALEGREWLVGSTFTLVDLHLIGAVGWIGSIGIDLAPFANVAAWVARGQKRPSFTAIMRA